MKSSFDLHVHLYGVLAPEDIYKYGKSIWQQRKERLKWFAKEYFKSWGVYPQWEKYWTAKDGFSLLKKDYLFTKKNSFARFQSCFNLIIALFPIVSTDKDFVKILLDKLVLNKQNYYEVRIVFPFYFKNHEMHEYLTTVSSSVKEKKVKVKFIVSLTRENKAYLEQYAIIKKWQADNKILKEIVVGIDFAADEESDSLVEKKSFITKVLNDNLADPKSKLLITCHTGESFVSCGMLSACKKIWTLSRCGTHRLANTIALGKNPWELKNKIFKQKTQERISTLKWALSLLKSSNLEELKKYVTISLEKQEPTDYVFIQYTDLEIQLIEALQDIVCLELKNNQTILEVCPTSNYLIGEIDSYKSHPLHKFLQHGLQVCICSDDPGIFATNLQQEYKFCSDKLKICMQKLQTSQSAVSSYVACKEY
jgi:adenosine deaminase